MQSYEIRGILYGRKQAKWRAGEEVRMEWCGAKMEKKSFSVHISTGQIYNCIRINLWKVHIVWNDKRYIWKDRRQNDQFYFILSRVRNLKMEWSLLLLLDMKLPPILHQILCSTSLFYFAWKVNDYFNFEMIDRNSISWIIIFSWLQFRYYPFVLSLVLFHASSFDW